MGLVTRLEFFEEYQKKANASDKEDALLAVELFDQIKQGIMVQELKRVFGEQITVGADGSLVGFGGQEMTPEQVLQAAGQKALPVAPAMGQGGNGAMPARPALGLMRQGGMHQ